MIDSQGGVHFKTSLQPTSVSNRGIGDWTPGGTARVVHRNGGPAPEPPGAAWEGIFPFESAVNGTGMVAFAATFTEPAAPGFQIGIWAGDIDQPNLVARTGQQAPGMDSGVVFDQLTNPEINAEGRVAMRAKVVGPGVNFDNDEGLFLQDGLGNLQLVAREGDAPPGAPDGVVFKNSFVSGMAFNDIALNDAGQIAFLAFYTGLPTPGNLNQKGVWATDRQGNLELIAMSGVEFQTDRGTTVHGSMGFAGGTGGDEGYGVGINDLGQVAFSASFTSPAAVYLSDRVAVPEPSSMVLISIFVCCMLCGWHANRSVRQS